MNKMVNGKKGNMAGLPAGTLKWLALIAMFLDHFAAVFLSDYVYRGVWNEAEVFSQFMDNPANIGFCLLYSVLRSLGRISLPLYCFLLAEGLKYTKSRWKYALRILLFACISEIPFDYGVYYKLYTFEKQNIFFTLFIGFLVIWIADETGKWKMLENKKALQLIFQTLSVIAGGAAAFYLKTDYGIGGVMIIAVMYFIQKEKKVQAAIYAAVTILLLGLIKIWDGADVLRTAYVTIPAFAVFMAGLIVPWKNVSAILLSAGILCGIHTSEIYAVPASGLVFFYNGEKGAGGRIRKWFFYFFYPMHLGFLILLRFLLGHNGIWL